MNIRIVMDKPLVGGPVSMSATAGAADLSGLA